MIPYFEFTTVSLGPLVLQVWGFFVALGILVGLYLSAWRAAKMGLAKVHVYDAGVWIILAAFLGARVVHVLFYELSYYLASPVEIFKIWHGGYSVIGGFIGAVLAGVWYYRRVRVDLLDYADATIFGLPLGLGIGRIGCFLIHDHPGTATHFILGVNKNGGMHDHGLYLSINGFLLAFVFAIMSRFDLPRGSYLVVFGVWYGAVRFFLDFYRLVDTTYFGLTPAQYVSGLLFIGGLVWGRILLKGYGGRDKM